MRRGILTKIILTLITIAICFPTVAQTTTSKFQDDASLPENRYGPFHQTIDSTQRTVSKFGHYVSIAFGPAHEYGFSGTCALFSYSVAYKSLIFSVTRAGSGVLFNGGSDRDINYSANYLGFLIGESVRFKYALFSISAGLANSNIELSYPVNNNQKRINYNQYNTLSMPLELKFFLLARNGVGLGIHVCENILSPSQYSPGYFGVGLVFGGWNRSRP